MLSFGMRSGEQPHPCAPPSTQQLLMGLVPALSNGGKAPKWGITPQNRGRGKNLLFPLGPDCWGIHREQNVGKEEISDVKLNTENVLILISASAKEKLDPNTDVN